MESVNMTVGFMRNSKRPRFLAKLTSMLCSYYGITLLYFSPSGISLKKENINGYILKDDKWIAVEREIPKFTDIRSPVLNRRRYQKQISLLKEKSILTVDKRMPLPKDKLHIYFKDDPEISKYLIPSKTVKKFSDFDSFLKDHQSVVLKPIRSNQGRGVSLIQSAGRKWLRNVYKVGQRMTEEQLTSMQLKRFIKDEIDSQSMLVQKYINSRTPQGHPFDCRVHVEKNGKGQWSNPHNFIRIGVGQKVVSNINQGGGIGDVKDFLKSYYPEHYKKIRREIRKIARTLPYKIEEKLGKQYMTFGFDFGIDKEGNLFLFEINDNPLISPMRSKVAMLRVGYYKYMLNKINQR